MLPREISEALPDMQNLTLVDLEASEWPSEAQSPVQILPRLKKLAYLRVVGAPQFPQAFALAAGLPQLRMLDLARVGGKIASTDIPSLKVKPSPCHLTLFVV